MKLSSVLNFSGGSVGARFSGLREFANDIRAILSPPLPQTTEEVREWLRLASKEHYLLHEKGIPSRLSRMGKNNITIDYSELKGERGIVQTFGRNQYTHQIIGKIVTNIQE